MNMTERTMKRILTGAVALFGLCIVASFAMAQTVPGKADLSWPAVTMGCTIGVTPCDNAPLSGASAITGYEIYVSTSAIPDSSTAAPVATVTGSAVTFAYTTTVTNGQTLYFRVKAVNAFGKSAFSVQESKLIVVPVLPGVPTSVTITLTIG
jgi:predicted phage tail protein